jgi:probable F420-dependent oxidoreductase
VTVRVGAVFPQTEIGADRGGVRAYAEAVTELHFTHLLASDHVVGADPAAHPGFRGPYDVRSTFHEPFALLGFLAAITPLELGTGIVILPQRQTVLVAKQAAEVDLLTGGRFRLGVGIGWNPVEYVALGQDFTTRGRRAGEQVRLMRRLWTERSVTFEGRYDRVAGAGLAPLPVQRPIPVWFGGSSPPAYRRAGRLADGWFPELPPGPELEAAKQTVRAAALAAGRDPQSLGMEGRITLGPGGAGAIGSTVEEWRRAGASHVCVDTMGAGLATVDQHIAVLAKVATALALKAPAAAPSAW